MGSSITNVAIQHPQIEEVQRAVTHHWPDMGWCLAATSRWCVLYGMELDRVMDRAARPVARALARELHCVAMAISVYDSDKCQYWLYGPDGAKLDAFSAWAASPVSIEATEQRSDVLVKYCEAESARSEICRILSAPHIFAEEQMVALLRVLGIADEVYSYDDVYDHPDFVEF